MEMELKRMKMTDISQHPQNVRIHTKRNLDLLKNSLSTFGLYKPILVQKSTKYIIAGNGTYQAAQALGWEQIDCNLIDVNDEQAKTILIMDNRSTDLSEMDEKAVLDLLKDFDADSLDLSGYDDKEIDKMLSFQEGTLFDDQKKEKKSKQKKDKTKEVPINADDQISFILMGYPFVLSDPDQIKEIKNLMDKFEKQNIEIKCQTTFEIWKAIKDVLFNATGVDENNSNNDDEDMSIETDRK